MTGLTLSASKVVRFFQTVYSDLKFPVQTSQPMITKVTTIKLTVNVGIYHSGLSSPAIQLNIEARRKAAEIPFPCSMGTVKLLRPNMSTTSKMWCSAIVSNYSYLLLQIKYPLKTSQDIL